MQWKHQHNIKHCSTKLQSTLGDEISMSVVPVWEDVMQNVHCSQEGQRFWWHLHIAQAMCTL